MNKNELSRYETLEQMIRHNESKSDYGSEVSEESSHPALIKVGLISRFREGKWELFGMYPLAEVEGGITGYMCCKRGGSSERGDEQSETGLYLPVLWKTGAL